MVLAFTTVLLIEKIIADDHHHHSEEEKHARRTTIKAIKESQQMAESENHEVINETGKNKPQDSDLQHGPKMIAHSFDISQNTEPSPGAIKRKLLAENPNPVIKCGPGRPRKPRNPVGRPRKWVLFQIIFYIVLFHSCCVLIYKQNGLFFLLLG